MLFYAIHLHYCINNLIGNIIIVTEETWTNICGTLEDIVKFLIVNSNMQIII